MGYDFHARPSTNLVTHAKDFKSDMYILYNGHRANIKSILSVMALELSEGANIVLEVVGEDEADATECMEQVLLIEEST